jgi:hypothetical protein
MRIVEWMHETIGARFRPKRLRALYQGMSLARDSHVLDVGGTLQFWEFAASLGYSVPKVTIVNVGPPLRPPPFGIKWIVSDGRRLPLRDATFDVVIANSVIEHVGVRDNQAAFAREVRRVGRRYFVQTPDRRFPVETHFLAPFLHWFPRRWWYYLTALTPHGWHIMSAERRQFTADLWLLDAEEMRSLFPDSQIVVERLGGWPKSILAIHVSKSPLVI